MVAQTKEAVRRRRMDACKATVLRGRIWKYGKLRASCKYAALNTGTGICI